MNNFTIYRDGKYDIRANAAMKLERIVKVLDNAQTALFVEHRIGRVEFDKF